MLIEKALDASDVDTLAAEIGQNEVRRIADCFNTGVVARVAPAK